MPLRPCRECKKEISDSAAACPHCGAPTFPKKRPVSKMGTAIAILVGLWVLIKITSPGDSSPIASTSAASTPSTSVATPQPDPVQQNYQAAFAMDQKGAREYLKDRLQEFCQKEDAHLNYIEARIRPAGKGVALYCVHDFYTKYALSSGSRGPSLDRWVGDHQALLAKNNVTRVGVWGTGSNASGAWFEVK
jgi:hypothetical protein